MSNQHDWLLRRSLRSTDALRLWAENPRLDPEETYLTIRDFAEEITRNDSDKRSFYALARSIATLGFISGEPIVVWQNEDNRRFYVAEGNRRVLALKLLRNPEKAPRSMRSLFHRLSLHIDRGALEKIFVCVAPTFENAEWYISQRNSITSLQQKWSTEQQRRWVADLYEKYDGDLSIIQSKIEISESDLQAVLRILKLKEKVKELNGLLTSDEYKEANSHRFPLTTLERFFGFTELREIWGIEYQGSDIVFKADNDSFLNAYAELIKRMLLPKGIPGRIDSRTISTLPLAREIQNQLPEIIFDPISEPVNEKIQESESVNVEEIKPSQTESITPYQRELNQRASLKGNPDRANINYYFLEIQSVNYRVSRLFNDLKKLPTNRYLSSTAASLRVFLDLCVLNYIETEQLEREICAWKQKALRLIPLSERIEFIKSKLNDSRTNQIIDKLLNYSNDFSLDVLNGYVHSTEGHHLNINFLNRFWDFLLPLFEKLVVIKESEI